MLAVIDELKDFEIDPDELASIFFDPEAEIETDFPEADTSGIVYVDKDVDEYYSTTKWLETEYQ